MFRSIISLMNSVFILYINYFQRFIEHQPQKVILYFFVNEVGIALNLNLFYNVLMLDIVPFHLSVSFNEK